MLCTSISKDMRMHSTEDRMQNHCWHREPADLCLPAGQHHWKALSLGMPVGTDRARQIHLWLQGAAIRRLLLVHSLQEQGKTAR